MRSYLGMEKGVRGETPYNFVTTPLDCKKTPFLNAKIHSILNIIGCLLYDAIH